MTTFTISPSNSIATSFGDGLSLGNYDQLTILSGGSVTTSAAMQAGVAAFGGNIVAIHGLASGAGAGLRISGEATVTIGSNGRVEGGQWGILAAGGAVPLDLTNQGTIRVTSPDGLHGAAVDVTGFVLDFANYGLIQAAVLPGADGRRLALSLMQGVWMDFANGGQIQGSVRAEAETGFRFLNGGTITEEVLLTETGSDMTRYSHFGNTGTVAGKTTLVAGDLTMDLAGGSLGEVAATVQSADIFGVGGLVTGAFRVVASDQGGYSSFVHMSNMSTTRFEGGVEVTAPHALLEFTSVTNLAALTLAGGDVTVVLSGGTVGAVTSSATATEIDASGALRVGPVSLGAGADRYLGHEGADLLRDLGGADVIDLGGGNDRIAFAAPGEAGDDLLAGGLGEDWLDYGELAVAVKVDLTLGTAGDKVVKTPLSVGNDTISGFEHVAGSTKADNLLGDAKANWLIGNAGDDRLTGRDGRDTLSGGLGNDTLLAGNGADTLNGGGGADVFSFKQASESRAGARDLIQDFETGIDRLDLTLFDGDATLAGTQAFTAAQLRITTSGSLWIVTGDILGTAEDFVIASQTAIALTDLML